MCVCVSVVSVCVLLHVFLHGHHALEQCKVLVPEDV